MKCVHWGFINEYGYRDERYRASLSEISPALKNYEIVLTADEKLEKYIKPTFLIKNGDYVEFKLDNLGIKKQYNI